MSDSANSGDLGFNLDDDAWLEQARSALTPDSWDNLGEYEILNEVSRGGQGVVLRARNSEGQIVAIKRLLAGTLTGTRGRLRFEREMEIAARLNHPSIVPLLRRDIVDRQPLLVMPWVEGVPPNRWARPQDGPARSQRQILHLLLGICEAISHAHQRGVIHRDLKPSNILVDAEGQPHVLDFGIGKLLQEDAQGGHDLTRTSEFVGSPTYAPPERLLGSLEPTDVRDDVYSLGVLLYGLLADAEPYPFGDTIASAIRALQENDPTPIRKHAAHIDRDLAVVVHKAIAKEPNLRYASVEAFAADLQRFLHGEAVLAHPPSRWYRMQKYVQRFPVPIGLGALSLALIIGFGSYAIVQADRLTVERNDAIQARSEAAEAVIRTQDALGFLTQEVLAQLDPNLRGRVASIPEILRDAAVDIESRFAEDPDLEIEIRMAIGRLQLLNGDFSGASNQLDQASALIPIAEKMGVAPSAEHRLELALMHAEIHMLQAKFADVAADLTLASQWIDADSSAKNRHHLARLRIRQAVNAADSRHAEALCRAHLEALNLPNDAAEAWQTRLLLASLLRTNGKARVSADLALSLVQEARLNHPNKNHLDLADATREWAWSLFHAGSLREAEAPMLEALAMRRELLGPVHPDVAQSLMDVATWSQFFARDAVEITAKYEEAVHILRSAGAERHRLVASAWNGLANLASDRGDFVRADELYQEAFDLLSERLGEHHPLLAGLWMSRGQMQTQSGAFESARASFLNAKNLLLDDYEAHVDHSALYMAMAQNEEADQHPEQAILDYQLAIDFMLLKNLNGSIPLSNCYVWMGKLQQQLGQVDAAAKSSIEAKKWRDAAMHGRGHGG